MSTELTSSRQPTLSVIVEGYNETRNLGEVEDTYQALLKQDFPLNEIELLLCGTPDQAEHWRTIYADSPFYDVKALGLENMHYFVLKNAGHKAASGRIIANTDADVQPEPGWAQALVAAIDAGADASAGASLFNKRGGIRMGPHSPVMLACASQTWGWVLGRKGAGGIPKARGFMDHNIGFRADVIKHNDYETRYGRVLSSSILFADLVEKGHKVVITPGQEAAHVFYWSYWLVGLHVRYGHETWALRREDSRYPNQWIRKTGSVVCHQQDTST